MCDLDVLIVVRDRLLDKVTQYTSAQLGEQFSIDKAYEKIKRDLNAGKNVKTFTDIDYDLLKISQVS